MKKFFMLFVCFGLVMICSNMSFAYTNVKFNVYGAGNTYTQGKEQERRVMVFRGNTNYFSKQWGDWTYDSFTLDVISVYRERAPLNLEVYFHLGGEKYWFAYKDGVKSPGNIILTTEESTLGKIAYLETVELLHIPVIDSTFIIHPLVFVAVLRDDDGFVVGLDTETVMFNSLDE